MTTAQPSPELPLDMRAHWQDDVPYNKACGMEVTRWDEDGVTIEMPEQPWLMNGLRMLHGGAVAALCDTAGGGAVMAAHSPGGGRLSTISMTVQYLSPATGRLRAEARCTKRGRQVSFAEVTVTNADGKPVAHAVLSITVSPSSSRSKP